MKNKGILLLLLCTQAAAGLTQDVHFSQFYEMPLLRNPALTGNFNGLYRFQGAYRKQWWGVYDRQNPSRPYMTAGFGGEVKMVGYCIDDPLTVTGGAQLLVDQAGTGLLKRSSYLVSIAGKWLTTPANNSERFHVSAGLYGGRVSSGFNSANFRWSDQYVSGSPNLVPTSQPFPFTSKSYWDVGLGILFNYKSASKKRFYLGVAGHHLNQPNTGFDGTDNPGNKLPVRLAFNLGMLFPAENQRSGLRLYAEMMAQGGQNQLLFGGIYKFNLDPYYDVPNEDAFGLSIGMFHRFNDALIPVVNINWMRTTLGLSYDCRAFRFSDNYRPYGSFEITLKFRGIIEEKKMACEDYGCEY